MYTEAKEQEGSKMIPAIEGQIERLVAEIEAARERGEHGYAEELNYELDELCNRAEQDGGI